MTSALETHKKDLEAEVSTIKSEIQDKAVELTSILGQIESAKVEQSAFQAEKQAFYDERDKEKAALALARTEIATEKEQFATEKESKVKELKEISSDIKDRQRELTRLNGSCLNAASDVERLSKEKLEIETKITELANLVVRYEELQSSIKSADSELATINGKVATALVEGDAEISLQKEKIATLRNEFQVVSLQKDKTEYELKDLTDRLYQFRTDYQVIKDRIEGVWGKTFPELEIPLNV